MRRHDVLILSDDALAAALLGAAAELVGHQPRFPEPNESARDALRRVRPVAVVVDCDHEEACTEGFVGPALMTGARLLIVHSDHHGERGVEVARRLSLDVVRLPEDYDSLMRVLRELPALNDGRR